MRAVQHAVDAQADARHVASRLQVDVPGALLERVLPQPVDHLHDALVVGVELALTLPSSTSCSKLLAADAPVVLLAKRTEAASE